ncbi:phosphatidylinositol transfer protein alpha isoform-like [Oncorhynchus masou masou]|uniref:phosphatidylinositol transfer protein alpha isoform-like n=1 Tax=Oncorhynchus masou masou TaxID=90313 RepID=UPI00318320C5
MPQKALIHDVVTRWGSTHKMLERFLRQQQPFTDALASETRVTLSAIKPVLDHITRDVLVEKDTEPIPIRSLDYKPEDDPTKFKSGKTGRGPLGPDWKKELPKKTDCPHMCAYKLVTVKFKWWGLQNKVENFIQKQEKRLFTNFHRQLFCWIDKWIELTMEDIRRMEDDTRKELDELPN